MTVPKSKTVLISGTGIAGPTLAYWLARYGFRPTLIESAPALRSGGYMIDFWGVGYDVADRMNLIPSLREKGYAMKEVRLVDGEGRRKSGFDVAPLRAVAKDRFFSILRGDLAAEIYRALGNEVETLFGDSIISLDDDGSGVDVSFRHASPRRFDIVVGADGLHSAVRRIVFGQEGKFEHFLGYYVASFGTKNYPRCDPDVYVSHTVPGRQIARYALRDGRTVFLLIWSENEPLPIGHHDIDAQKAIIRQRFSGMGWESDTILERLDSSDDLYFDPVSQIRMPRWHREHVALVGDAAFCPSLLAGEGSAFAMTGAYVLAGKLRAAGRDPATAFARYEEKLRTFIEGKQRAAIRLGGWFAPKTGWGLALRDQATRLLSLPLIGTWMFKAMIADDFALPNYPA